ncbi:hypothetical protein BD414DRAFT_516640 [Trametes punicea]|nr:hypothetical protein BD414DRAFT_516640 [Trametes punicea]
MLLYRTRTTILSSLNQGCPRASCRSYSNKVRAFPFAVSQEKAIADLSFSAACFTGKQVLATWLRHLLPSLNVDALRPIRSVPAYLPAWIIDAELEATVWSKKQDADDHFRKDVAQIQFSHSCFVHTPLSALSLVTPRLLNTGAVPWSEAMRRHEGQEVLCLPFSITPFHLPEAARSLSMADANIAGVLRFEPSSVRETMMAAYPVLIPIYLAQYEVREIVGDKGQNTTISAFIEAGIPNGRRMIEVLPDVELFFNIFNLPVPDLFIWGRPATLTRCFANVRSLIANNVTLQHRTLVEKWVDRAMTGGAAALQRYRDRYFGTSEAEAARKVDMQWADPRIRPFEKEERSANLQWLSSGADLFLLRSMLQVYNSKRERGRVGQEADCNDTENPRGEEAVLVVRVRDPTALTRDIDNIPSWRKT